MIKLEEHKKKINDTIIEISQTTSYKRKNDLKRYLTKLKRELNQYYMIQKRGMR